MGFSEAVALLAGKITAVCYGPLGKVKVIFCDAVVYIPEPEDVLLVGIHRDTAAKWIAQTHFKRLATIYAKSAL